MVVISQSQSMPDTQRSFKIIDTTATKKIFALRKKIRAVRGGTSASKTVSILIWCIDYAQSTKGDLISIVSVSFPHLEKGAILDFKTIMKDRGYWKDALWNESKHFYEFETGSKIEFFSSEADKAHGPRRDILFLNEAQNLPYAEVDQLMVRTRKIIWMDWNPTREFYFDTDMWGKRDDIDFITLTYKDNEGLDEATIREIESRKDRRDWWQVYGLGLPGMIEGLIYKDWKIIPDIPHEARLERYGLDFGYTNDPTAIVAVYYYNGGYILDEIAFTKGLSNKQIADIFRNLPTAMVVADSAEPKSIDEIKAYDVPILPAVKGKDSVRNGIQIVQSQRISVTQRSLHIIKAQKNYMWATDRLGTLITPNEPDHFWSDTMDATRYALASLLDVIPTQIRVEQRDQFNRAANRQQMNSGK